MPDSRDRTPLSSRTDESLAALAADGSEEAFALLVSRYEKMVFHAAYLASDSEQDAFDLSQEIFLKLFCGLPGYRGESRFSTWLYAIAKRACVDYVRKKRREPPVLRERSSDADGEETVSPDPPDLSGAHDPEEQLTRSERSDCIREAVRSLPPAQADVVRLCDIEGISYAHAAELLGIPSGTVKSRLFRARAEIRKFLKKRNFFP